MSSQALPHWYYDLTDTSNAVPVGVQGVQNPRGFQTEKSKKTSGNKPTKMDDNDQLKVKKAWEVALAPAKSLPMNLIMSYMSGNSLQIVPIMMTSMMFFMTPFKQILNTNQAFTNLESKTNTSDIQLTKVVYVICHLLAVVVGVWKLGMMGLLPNTRSDWLAWESQSSVVEKSL